MMQLLQRRQHTDPTSAELREQHRDTLHKLATGRAQVAALEAQGEQRRMHRAALRESDPIHTDLPELDIEVQQAESELSDLVAQQRFRERTLAGLEIAIRIAEQREAPALQAERSARHEELRRALPDKLRAVLSDVETIGQLQADMAATHHAYGIQSAAEVLPLGGVLDRLRQALGGSAEELERYAREAVVMQAQMESSGMGRLVSGAHWVES